MSSDIRGKNSEEFSGLYFSFLVVATVAVNLIVSAIMKVACGTDKAYADFVGGNVYKYISYSLASFVILISAVVFTAPRVNEVSEICALKKADGKYYLLAALVFFATFFGLSGVNGYFIDFLKKYFGYNYVEPVLPEFSAFNFAAVTLTVCVLPAFFEELAFRGILVYGLRGVKPITAALIGGLCFSIFHMNPAQTPYQFAVGFSFALLSIRSGSIFPSVAAHFANNFLIICLSYFSDGGATLPSALGYAITAAGVIAFVAFIVICLKGGGNGEENSKGKVLRFFEYALFGIIICAVMWIAGLL